MGTTSQKLTYLNTTKQLLKTEINKINNVLTDNITFRSYPQELFNGYLDILNNGTDTLWNNLEKVSQTGTEAVLESVETAPMKMVLNGNTSQDGEPTPDTPIPVQVVTGENVVSVSGKNLVDFENVELPNQSGAGTLILDLGENKTLENLTTTFFFEDTIYTYETGNAALIDYRKEDGTHQYITARNFGLNTPNISFSGNYSKTETNIEFRYIYIYLGATYNKFTQGTASVQVELNSTPTEFEPYSKTDYPLSLGTLELCKIGDYKDYLFKRNGKWYVHKEIGKDIINEEKNIAFNGSASTPTERSTFRWYLPSNSGQTNFISNRFIYQSSTSNRIVLIENTNRPYLSIDNTIAGINVEDTDTTKVSKLKTWLSNNNVTLYYVLATPTETEITNSTLIEQLETISKAKSVKDKTYITQTNDELPFILDVQAIKEYEVV